MGPLLALYAVISSSLVMSVEGSFLHQPADFHNRFLAGVKSEDDCTIVEECSLCDAVARSSIAECKKTGRIERWRCESEPSGEEGEEEEETERVVAGAGTSILYRSCNRTKADDEFLMVRLQVVCVLVGTAAFVSARKQKVLSASLFDQRKLGNAQENKRRRRDSSITTPAATTEVEMVQMEETIPLTEDVVDVV